MEAKRFLTLLLVIMCSVVSWGQSTITHVVQRGETIERVAQMYGISVEQLKEANPSISQYFYTGMKLTIPNIISNPKKDEANLKGKNLLQTESQIQEDYQIPGNENMSTDIIEETESLAQTWQIALKMGPAFFKTERSGSYNAGGRTSNSSTGYEIDFGANYYLIDNIYLSGRIGYYVASSSSLISSMRSSTRNEVKSHNIIMPIEAGCNLPIVKDKVGFVLETGVSFLYAVGGYYKSGDEKISFSKMEDDYNADIERFGAFCRISAGFSFGGIKILAYYGIPLSSKAINVKKDEKFWGITVGI